jgi:potassium efflux system protein
MIAPLHAMIAAPWFANLLAATATVVAAAVLYWALHRAARLLRRQQVLQSHRGRGAESLLVRWAAGLEFCLFLLRVLVGAGAAWLIAGQLTGLRPWRELLAMIVGMSLDLPLVTISDHPYTARQLLELPAALVVVWLAITALTHALRTRLLRLTPIQRGAQETVVLLARYGLLFVATVVVLQLWGLDVSSLTFLASLLGVGIGFGLQNIANNFVSGLVVSFEKPIQPGDFIKVGEHSGTVERIGPRSTEVRTLDNVSILLPNSKVLETEVINWSHGDPVYRLHVPVGIAYGADVRRVRAALLETAREHPGVLRDPRPRVELRGFGASSLDFELLVWAREPRQQNHLRSDLNCRIEAALRRYRIPIPFPQRDVHLRSPQIEPLLQAWSGRTVSAGELAPTGSEIAPDPPQMTHAAVDDEMEPKNWPQADIDRLVGDLRGPHGLTIADHRHLFSVYPRVFVGYEAIDWLVAHCSLTRSEAIELGQLLVDHDVIHHVHDEHGFKDGNFFYRFRADERVAADVLGGVRND